MIRHAPALLLAMTACLALTSFGPAPSPAGQPPVLEGIDVTSGNLMGGTVVTLSVSNVSTTQGLQVSIGGQPAQIVSIVPDQSITIETPSVVEPSGAAVEVSVRNADGRSELSDVFTYTPALHVEVIGSAADGGGLIVTWQSAGLAPEATMTVWVGDPTQPAFASPLPHYAGVLYEEPGLGFVSTLASEGSSILHFPALPAWIVGFPLHLQGLASKEGAHKGSFTNVVTFVVP